MEDGVIVQGTGSSYWAVTVWLHSSAMNPQKKSFTSDLFIYVGEIPSMHNQISPPFSKSLLDGCAI